MHNNDLYILDAGTVYKVNADKTFTKLNDGMEGGTDGIENVSGNDSLFCVGQPSGTLMAKETKSYCRDTREQKRNTADLSIDAAKKIVYIPAFWKNSVVAYELE